MKKLLALTIAAGAAACSSEMDGMTGADSGVTPTNEDAGPIVFDASLGGTAADRGKNVFRSYRCANCHGPDALGNPAAGGPNIVGRTAADILKEVKEPCENPDEIGTCHPLKLPDLTQQVADDVAAYLAELARTAMPADPGPPCDDVEGNICTILGNGLAGNKPGDGILARDQHLFWPQNVTVDPQGRVVATDWNNYLIRRIEKTGCRDVMDGQGRMVRDCPVTNIIGTSGLGDSCSTASDPVAGNRATMNHPVGVDYFNGRDIVLWGWHQWKIKYLPVDDQGNVGEMFCVWGNARGYAGDCDPQLAKTNPSMCPAAGTGQNRTGKTTLFNLPSSAVMDKRGDWYISDQANLRIRKILKDANDVDTRGVQWAASRRDNPVFSWAGGEPRTRTGDHARTLPDYSNSGDGGPVGRATFRVQFGFDAIPQMRLAIDRERDLLYVADAENGRIRVIDLDPASPKFEIIETFAGCQTEGPGCKRDATTTTSTTWLATQAFLYRPGDVDVMPDGSGDVIITDVYNHCIRLVRFSDRTIHTMAGVCDKDDYGYSGDGGPATMALLAEPGGAGADRDRNIYVADTLNHRIRKVNKRTLPR